jgi:uncharacterized phage-associated protein
MIYTKLTKLATQIAFKAHRGQMGKDGLPYICHPLHVAEQMDDETSACVALLHDVIEDCPSMTPAVLIAEGMPRHIVEHVVALTRKREEKYFDYIERVAEDPIATKVKLADLEHNLDEDRLEDGMPKSLKKRYEKARARLMQPPSDVKEKFGDRPIYTASDIAAHIITHSNNEHLNNLKLQKLLYLCQKQCLHERKMPLFEDKIEAWTYGPVVPAVYNAYSYRGASRLRKPVSYAVDDSGRQRPVILSQLDEDTAAIVDNICQQWDNGSVFDLIGRVNRKDGAWYATYRPDSESPRFGAEITLDAIISEKN